MSSSPERDRSVLLTGVSSSSPMVSNHKSTVFANIPQRFLLQWHSIVERGRRHTARGRYCQSRHFFSTGKLRKWRGNRARADFGGFFNDVRFSTNEEVAPRVLAMLRYRRQLLDLRRVHSCSDTPLSSQNRYMCGRECFQPNRLVNEFFYLFLARLHF